METRSCKVCKRSFPNGRSLGGHMRSHVKLKSFSNHAENSETRYGLREKPKKSRRFDDEDVDEEEKDSIFDVLRNRRQRRRSKLVDAIFASSSSPALSSPEYGALCLMLLSRESGSFSVESEVKRSESDVLRIGFKKVDSFPSESGFHHEDDVVEFEKDVNFAAVIESGKRSVSKRRNFDAGIESFSNRSKYECTVCKKSFFSYQALGGHCSSHKKMRSDSSSVAEHLISQKFGRYQCPICEKVYPSGQALGGHKRSHLIAGNSDVMSTKEIEIEQKKDSKLNLLDLNLPASDFEVSDSFDSNRSIGEEDFTVSQENCRLAAFMM